MGTGEKRGWGVTGVESNSFVFVEEEEKGREKNGESESGSRSGSGSKGENLLQCQRRNRQFKAWAVSRFICDVPIARPRANSTGHNPGCSHRRPSSHPALPRDTCKILSNIEILTPATWEHTCCSTALPGHSRFGGAGAVQLEAAMEGWLQMEVEVRERAWSDARADLSTFPWPA